LGASSAEAENREQAARRGRRERDFEVIERTVEEGGFGRGDIRIG
jgi:hypothetical protein